VQLLLQLAQVADRQTLRRGPTQPLVVARTVLEHLAFQAERRDISLRLEDNSAGQPIDADAGALFVLVKNLVDNALGFAPPGSAVELRLEGTGLSVSDRGPGVPPELREHVFERFWRAPGQARAGSGLGLALVREIAHAHGWTVHCTQTPGGGASFVLRWAGPAAD
jgi:signal transduction histidine kinase